METITQQTTQTIQKSALIPIGQSDENGAYDWQIDPTILLQLFGVCAEHARCIQIKATGAFGGGLVEAQNKLDDITPHGFTDLCQTLILDQETFGNAFMQIVKVGDKTELLRLPAHTMKRLRKGGFIQIFGDGDKEVKQTFDESEVLHLRGACPSGGFYALPTWIGARGILDLVESIVSYNHTYFKNSALPQMAVVFEGAKASRENIKAVRNFLEDSFKGFDNAHKTLVMESPKDASIKFEKLSDPTKDGDFLKLLDATRDRIAIAHGVPPRMLGIMSAGQLGGSGEVSGQIEVFERYTLEPLRKRFCDQ